MARIGPSGNVRGVNLTQDIKSVFQSAECLGGFSGNLTGQPEVNGVAFVWSACLH